jgi:late competence protein required for DNA uptake (superfamily II DNA/RNA helicase)
MICSISKSTYRQANRNNNQVLETRIQVPDQKGDSLVEQLNFEIECPRCSDVMELFSEFEHLSYYCASCRLELDVH